MGNGPLGQQVIELPLKLFTAIRLQRCGGLQSVALHSDNLNLNPPHSYRDSLGLVS